MADPRKKLADNVTGDFFVDSTCIDCDTCRQLAPSVFRETGDYSVVGHQPTDDVEARQAMRALLSCPTGSIGTAEKHDVQAVMADFPLLINDDVYYCGFNSPKSYGGNSYFIRHPDGNWLVDSPKFLPHLVRRFEEMGGIRYIFLTHSDDVAEAHQFAEVFNGERIIHEREKSAQPAAERLIEGFDDVVIHPDFRIIPTPGHTAGHCVLLYKNRYLFTGDHMRWDRHNHRLHASSAYCWHSWDEQKRSIARLGNYDFEWVLPGHGQRVNLPVSDMKAALLELVRRIGA